MYIPPAFRMNDEAEMRSLMRTYDFALLLVPGMPDLAATHIPLKLADERQVLIGHVAMANPVSEAIKAGREAIAVFSGPHAYVSPTWYANPSVNVPTWNYVAVHAFGTLAPLDAEEAERALSSQVADFEAEWRITHIEPGMRSRLEASIQVFEFEINRLEGKAKLSQNKPVEERLRLAHALNERGEHAVAFHMVEDQEDEDG
ncbi:FMN-binding negative transcriptional regulator [Maricaulis sp.]|jgi:transcriptional regulator|uniref:FMN-binding negative transcriptional regulator n=1 Tax=Maricaulis sp. TaxID=1486257 RepID=UPI0026224487|nr:FMN-binding negative transcriptional regulator [Maricaulis sp.]